MMLAEIVFYVPSVSNFRLVWIGNKLSASYTAALVFAAAPEVPDDLSKQILDSIGARALALKMGQQRRLLAFTGLKDEVRQQVDIRDMMAFHDIVEAFETLLFVKDTDLLRAVGPAPMGGQFVEVVLEAVAAGDVALFAQRPPALDRDRGLDGGAHLLCAALSLRPPALSHRRQHDGVQRRAGKPGAHHGAASGCR
jgi:hypothetical protein